jgi:tRNA dimethylallyltransferase
MVSADLAPSLKSDPKEAELKSDHKEAEQKKVLFVVGPTASGKTDLAHGILSAFPEFELVNLDAFQFYKGMNIGTAKPSFEDRLRWSYRLLDFLEPDARMDAEKFASMARNEFDDIWSKQKIPLCVGGSGLYLRSLTSPMHHMPSANDQLRILFRNFATRWGWPHLHSWLKEWDPERAAQLHPNDKTRIERALEVYLTSGQKMSELYTLPGATLGYSPMVLQVRPKLDELRPRIRDRTLQMLEQGWLEEVQTLTQKWGESVFEFQSFQAIGYLTIARHLLEGKRLTSGENLELLNQIATETVQYARRQLTWNAKVTSGLVLTNCPLQEEDRVRVSDWLKGLL